MSKAYCCDLCGGLYTPIIDRRKFRFVERVPNTNGFGIETEKSVDVCPACYEEFYNFVVSKRNRNDAEVITEETKETEETEETKETKGGLL